MKTASKVRVLSENEETLRIIELRHKFESDRITQINGEKRKIAKNLLKKYPAMSIVDIAEVTSLPIDQIRRLKSEYAENE